jgi:osmotically-inducible protein OsmY
MEEHRLKRLPVMSGEAVVGIISHADLMRAFCAHSPRATAAALSDTAICEKLRATLDTEPWAPPHGCVNVAVANGVVDFDGVIGDERQRLALRIAAENLPGAKEVRDRGLRLEPGARG